MLLKIPEKLLAKSAKTAITFSFNKQAEQAIILLVFMKNFIDAILRLALRRLFEQAKNINRNINAVYGDDVKVHLRQFGRKYEIINQEVVDKKFLNVSYSVNSDEVAKYYKTYNKLPDGIMEVKRDKIPVVNEKEIMRKILAGEIDVLKLTKISSLAELYEKERGNISEYLLD